jgi:hypothetical protein
LWMYDLLSLVLVQVRRANNLPRLTGKPRLARTSLLLSLVSRLQNQVALRYLSSALNQQLSTQCQEKKFMATMLRVSWLSRSRGPVWPAPSGVPTSDTWTHT